MLLLLSAVSASIDSFIIGINFKLNQTKISILEFLEILLLTYFILLFLHFGFSLTNIQLTSKWIAPIIYISLGIFTIIHQEQKSEKKEQQFKISKKEIFLLVVSHSSDGFILSTTFLNKYSIPFLCGVFSLVGILFTVAGYKIAKNFPNSELVSAIFFFILALLSCF